MPDSLSSTKGPTLTQIEAEDARQLKKGRVRCPCSYKDHKGKRYPRDKYDNHVTRKATNSKTKICKPCFRNPSHSVHYMREMQESGESDECVERTQFWLDYKEEWHSCDVGVEDFLKWEFASTIPLEYNSTAIPDECKATKEGEEFDRDFWVRHDTSGKPIALCTACPPSYFDIRNRTIDSAERTESEKSKTTWLKSVMEDPEERELMEKHFKKYEGMDPMPKSSSADTAA